MRLVKRVTRLLIIYTVVTDCVSYVSTIFGQLVFDLFAYFIYISPRDRSPRDFTRRNRLIGEKGRFDRAKLLGKASRT